MKLIIWDLEGIKIKYTSICDCLSASKSFFRAETDIHIRADVEMTRLQKNKNRTDTFLYFLIIEQRTLENTYFVNFLKCV